MCKLACERGCGRGGGGGSTWKLEGTRSPTEYMVSCGPLCVLPTCASGSPLHKYYTHTHAHSYIHTHTTHTRTHTHTYTHTCILWAVVHSSICVPAAAHCTTHSYVWHASFRCVTRLIYMGASGSPLLAPFICVTWLITMWVYDSFISVTWRIHMCARGSPLHSNPLPVWIWRYEYTSSLLHSCICET